MTGFAASRLGTTDHEHDQLRRRRDRRSLKLRRRFGAWFKTRCNAEEGARHRYGRAVDASAASPEKDKSAPAATATTAVASATTCCGSLTGWRPIRPQPRCRRHDHAHDFEPRTTIVPNNRRPEAPVSGSPQQVHGRHPRHPRHPRQSSPNGSAYPPARETRPTSSAAPDCAARPPTPGSGSSRPGEPSASPHRRGRPSPAHQRFGPSR